MNQAAASPEPSPILAVTYADGIAADRFLAELGYGLRAAGVRIAGLVQHNRFVRDHIKCDMELEELASGVVLQISEYRGSSARGCRLDRAVLADVTMLVRSALAQKPAILVLNKFGKVEAEGGGLRDAFAEAIDLEIPIIVGVPLRNIDQWRIFADGLAQECPAERGRVLRWLAARKILPTLTVQTGAPQSGFPIAAIS